MASTDVCEVKPVEAFLSTNLNNRNKTYKDVADRIMRQLGFPSMSVELHRDQVYDAISIAIEFYSKYAGYTEEYLVFNSDLYERDKGLRIDKLCTIASNAAAYDAGLAKRAFNQVYDKTIVLPERVYVVKSDIPQEELPSSYDEGLKALTVVTAAQYDEITTHNPSLSEFFKKNRGTDKTLEGTMLETQPTQYENAFDYDLMDYRRVCEVVDYNESSTQSLNSMFTFESALASQTYYQYQFSQRGFDLLSFHTLHEFLKTRNRVLALERSWYFDPRTQYFTLLPQPKAGVSFWGVLLCRIEQPLCNMIDRIWVFKYALAQCKVMLGTIRGRYGQINLAGGGTFADNINLRASGEQEMKDLEKELIEGTAFSEKKYPLFFVG